MRRFTSGPKPGVARARVHVGDVGAVDPQAVAHAVVAREVRRRLGRRDQVVGRQPVHRRRHATPARPWRPRRSSASAAASTAALHVGLDALAVGQLLDDADAQALDAALELGRAAAARGAAIDVESHGSCPPITSSSSAASATDAANGPIWSSDDANAIEPVARHRAVGRLHADDAAQRRGLADRAAGVGAERERREPGRDRGRRAAARAARHPREVVRVARRAERGVLGGAAHRELVEVGLADRDRARVAQPLARRSRRTAGASPRGSATSTWWGRRACRGCP